MQPLSCSSAFFIFDSSFDVIGNGRGGESIYGGFFEGKEATVCCQLLSKPTWLQDGSTILSFPPR